MLARLIKGERCADSEFGTGLASAERAFALTLAKLSEIFRLCSRCSLCSR
jgi:hypothetical protein